MSRTASLSEHKQKSGAHDPQRTIGPANAENNGGADWTRLEVEANPPRRIVPDVFFRGLQSPYVVVLHFVAEIRTHSYPQALITFI